MPRKTKISFSKKIQKKKEAGNKLETQVYNLQGKSVGKMQLPEKIFSAKVNPVLLAQAVRVYQVNQRIGTHSSKTRTQVAGSTRKIYRQKGTGRARHGDVKAPIFVGGGVAHGPTPTDYHLLLPAKMKRLALFGSLTDKFQNNGIRIITGLKEVESKTKNIISMLKNLDLAQKDGDLSDKTLLVLPASLKNIVLAGRNIDNFGMKEAKLLNTYDVVASQNILFMKEAVKTLEEHFLSSHTKDVVIEDEPEKKSAKPQGKPAIKKTVRKAEKIQDRTKKKRKNV